jgi:hypothetical protein
MGEITRILWADFYYKIGNSAEVVLSEKVLNEAHGVKWIADQEARILNLVSEADLEAYKTSNDTEEVQRVWTSYTELIESYRRNQVKIYSTLRWEIVED